MFRYAKILKSGVHHLFWYPPGVKWNNSGDKLALLDEMNTFAGEIVFIALVAGELWENFYLWAERECKLT